MRFFDWLFRRRVSSNAYPEASCVVEFDSLEVRCSCPNGNVERVSWQELKGVILRNTNAGPVEPDVFWILVGNEGGCVIPQGAVGEAQLLQQLQKLPGFSNEAVIASAACTDTRDFLCWERVDS